MCEDVKGSDVTQETSEQFQVITGYTSMEQFTKDGFKTLMEAIKHANALPSGRDWDFFNTSDSFKQIINDEGNNVLQLMNQVMRCNEVDSNIRNRVLDEKIELIIEANDVILEKAANNLDELNGIRKSVAAPVVLQTVSAQLPVNGSWNKPSAATFSVNESTAQTSKQNTIKLLTAKNIIRPQKFFKDKIDNRNKIPWYPRITDKPNSLKPLAIFLEECDDRQEYSHPYEYELYRFSPTAEQLLEEKPHLPKSLSDTTLVEIDKPEQLDELVETLRTCKEFAVDVEHHSYRSFMGITCLLQISTQDKDYIIDTLALRDKLHILNEVFTRNSIVKIFHGADRDIEWLQRDLSIYVINMFDTHQAAKILQYQTLSLAFLMKKFCNVVPNKQYQLADWRIRPLPDELKEYAREDTHYLIYIYKMMKKELLLKANKSVNLLRSVIERSTDICKKRYFKPLLLEDSHLELYRKCKKMFDNRQLYALKEIFAWRDNLAREEDESYGYVLPNHMMLQISETLPREMQGILACCNPIPPLVRSHLLELHHIILKAREQPLEKAIMKDTTSRGVLKKVSKVNVDSALHCPHDLTKNQEFRDDLPTLLQNGRCKTDKILKDVLAIEKTSSYSVFAASESENIFNERETFKKIRGFAYLSPFERYKLVKPFVVTEEKEAEARKEDVKKKSEINESEKQTEKENENDKTDEERIASIKDHFVQLSRKFSQELQAQKEKEEEEERQRQRSLIEMGGSRKRKREEMEEDEYPEENTPANHHFHDPRPNINFSANFYKNRNKGKKRKFNEISDNQIEQPQGQSGKKKRKNKQKQKKQLQQQHQCLPQQQQQNQWRQQQHNVHQQQHNVHHPKHNFPKAIKKQNKQNQQQLPKKKKQNPNQGGRFQQFQGAQNEQPQNRQKNKQKFGKNKQNTNFAPYDYASVDFRQFQGGAGSASSGVQIKPNFKAKNRKNKNKKGAKSSTFGDLNINRGKQHPRNY